MRRLLQMNKLHFNGDERAGGGVWGRYRKRAEAKQRIETDGKVYRRGWLVEIVRTAGERQGKKRIGAPFYR